MHLSPRERESADKYVALLNSKEKGQKYRTMLDPWIDAGWDDRKVFARDPYLRREWDRALQERKAPKGTGLHHLVFWVRAAVAGMELKGEKRANIRRTFRRRKIDPELFDARWLLRLRRCPERCESPYFIERRKDQRNCTPGCTRRAGAARHYARTKKAKARARAAVRNERDRRIRAASKAYDKLKRPRTDRRDWIARRVRATTWAVTRALGDLR